MLDALEQLSISDAAVCESLELSEFTLFLALVVALFEQAASQELIQLVLIDDMTLVLDWTRVSCLEDKFGHESDLLFAVLECFVMSNERLFGLFLPALDR